MSELARTRLGFEHSDWLFGKLSFMKLSECILLDRMSVLPPKLAHIWVFLPSGAKKMQTLLQPSASGESAFFWLLQARIPRREPPSAAGLFQSTQIAQMRDLCFNEGLQLFSKCGVTKLHFNLPMVHSCAIHFEANLTPRPSLLR